MLKQATDNLIAIARDVSSTEAAVKAATQDFCNAVGRSSVQETNEALAALTVLFELKNLPRAGFFALLCGTCVERGCDPSAISRPLTQRLRSLLESAGELTAACLAVIGTSTGDDQDPAEAFESIRQRISSAMPHLGVAWDVLNQFWPPAIAVFSASAEARSAARGLRDLAARIADYHDAGHWLRFSLSVLDDEPILVIEPQTNLGILARISGVVDNFQLNVLLMDAFPPSEARVGRRVSPRVVEVARGVGPQRTEDGVQGVWNLHTWRAVTPDGKLPSPKDHGAQDWIWNEGVPEDIPVFAGRRVILLGPPSYVRNWQSQRIFANLPATLDVERKLAKDEVVDWIARMVAARNASY